MCPSEQFPNLRVTPHQYGSLNEVVGLWEVGMSRYLAAFGKWVSFSFNRANLTELPTASSRNAKLSQAHHVMDLSGNLIKTNKQKEFLKCHTAL